MADVAVPAAPPLSARRNVDLIHTGSWAISSGKWEASRDDLAAAVAALDCPAVRRPVLKLGHEVQDTKQPAIGWIDNLRTANQGYTLRGDYVGMPGWLGPILASAYPDRSVEGTYDYRCQLGHTHPFALTAVALLGVTPPGIGTLKSLQDVAALYGVTASAGGGGVSVVARFDPGQDRWDAGSPGGLGGQFRGDGLPELDPKRDKLKLAGRIPLGDGEQLIGSSVVDTESGLLPLAATHGPEGVRLRLGVGIEHEDQERWRAADRGSTINLDAAGITALQDALGEMRDAGQEGAVRERTLESQYDDLWNRQRALQRKQWPNLTKAQSKELDQLDEQLGEIRSRIASKEEQHQRAIDDLPPDARAEWERLSGRIADISRQRSDVIDAYWAGGGTDRDLLAQHRALNREVVDLLDERIRLHNTREASDRRVGYETLFRRRQAELDGLYTERDGAEARREELTADAVPLSAEDAATLAELGAELGEVDAELADLVDGETLAAGVLIADWGDLVYQVSMTDVGAEYALSVRPRAASAEWILGNEDDPVRLEAADLRELGEAISRLVGSMPVAASVNVLAAAEVHTGAMVALVPSIEDAARLAVDGGEDPDQLHVTLAYLGEAAAIPPATQAALVGRLRSLVEDSLKPDYDLPLVGDAFAVSMLNPPGAQGKDGKDRDACVVVGVGGEDLDAVHRLVTETLEEVSAQTGFEVPEQHRPWLPHITVAYTDDFNLVEELADQAGPVTFDRLRIAFAGENFDIPLRSSASVEAAGGDENQLKEHWTRGPGLKRWVASAHPWTTLYGLLRKHVGNERAKRMASEWFHEVFGMWSGDKRHGGRRVAAMSDRDFDEEKIKRDGEGQFARKEAADVLDEDEIEAYGGSVYVALSEDGAVSLSVPGGSPGARFSVGDADALRDGMFEMWRRHNGAADEERDGLIDDMLVETSQGPIYVGISRRELETEDGDSAEFPIVTLGVPTEAHVDDEPDFDEVDLDESDFDWVTAKLRDWVGNYEPATVDSIGASDYDAHLMADHTIRLDDGEDGPISLDATEAAELADALKALRDLTLPEAGDGEPEELDGTAISDAVMVTRWTDGVYVLRAATVDGAEVEVELGADTVDGLIDVLPDLVTKDAELPRTLGPRRVTASIQTTRSRSMPNPTPTSVAAGVTTDDIRAQYHQSAPHTRWITEMRTEPLELIVADDADGKRYRVPVSVEAGGVTFGSPVEVVIRYIEPDGEPVAASAVVYASRAESRPAAVVAHPGHPDQKVHGRRNGRSGGSSTAGGGSSSGSGSGGRTWPGGADGGGWGGSSPASDRQPSRTAPRPARTRSGGSGEGPTRLGRVGLRGLARREGLDVPEGIQGEFGDAARRLSAGDDVTMVTGDLREAAEQRRSALDDRRRMSPAERAQLGDEADALEALADAIDAEAVRGQTRVRASQTPAARPGNPSNQEETMPLSTEVLQRLGLADDADGDAVNAAVAAALDKADARTTEQVAASAATTELEKQVKLLTTQVEEMSAELAAAKAAEVATVKASVIGDALKKGKIAPAELEQWQIDYDAAPTAVTRVLASIAAGTRVPADVAGHSGDPDAGSDESEFDRLYPPALAGAGREG